MMNPKHAQLQWKHAWRRYHIATTKKARHEEFENMFRYGREAALERKLAAAQRTIEAQTEALAKAADTLATVSLEADTEGDEPIVRRYAINMCDDWLNTFWPDDDPEYGFAEVHGL